MLGWLWVRAHALIAPIQVSGRLTVAVPLVWATGAIAALACMMLRQRAFVRSLGRLVQAPDGTWRGQGVAEPMLVGALWPRVLVPLDFEQRFTADERELVLAHERAHMRRGDAVVNAVGVAVRLLVQPGDVLGEAPAAFRSGSRLRRTVLTAPGKSLRGRYAGALLKAPAPRANDLLAGIRADL